MKCIFLTFFHSFFHLSLEYTFYMDLNSKSTDYIKYHKGGSVWAKDQVVDNTMEGYWEWFRKDGFKMRSRYFKDGKQIGKWVTYDKNGRVVKITDMDKKK